MFFSSLFFELVVVIIHTWHEIMITDSGSLVGSHTWHSGAPHLRTSKKWMHWSAEPSVWIFMALNYNNAHARFLQENGRPYVWLSMEGVLDLRNGAVSEKTPQIFWPSLPAGYVTVFSGRTDAPEVRCDLTHTHTHTDKPTTVTLLRMRAEG